MSDIRGRSRHHDINKETNPFIDGKYGADRSQTVNVAGAIQRVEAHYVFTLRQKTHRLITHNISF